MEMGKVPQIQPVLHLHLSKKKVRTTEKCAFQSKNAQSSKNCARRFLLVWANVRGVYSLDMHLLSCSKITRQGYMRLFGQNSPR